MWTEPHGAYQFASTASIWSKPNAHPTIGRHPSYTWTRVVKVARPRVLPANAFTPVERLCNPVASRRDRCSTTVAPIAAPVRSSSGVLVTVMSARAVPCAVTAFVSPHDTDSQPGSLVAAFAAGMDPNPMSATTNTAMAAPLTYL